MYFLLVRLVLKYICCQKATFETYYTYLYWSTTCMGYFHFYQRCKEHVIFKFTQRWLLDFFFFFFFTITLQFTLFCFLCSNFQCVRLKQLFGVFFCNTKLLQNTLIWILATRFHVVSVKNWHGFFFDNWTNSPGVLLFFFVFVFVFFYYYDSSSTLKTL